MNLTNRRNRIIYHLWSPIYDDLFDRFFAAPGRRRAMQVLDLRPGERVMVVGAGTGADLPLLPAGVRAIGLDLSPDMLARARAKLPLTGRDVTLLQGDAQALPLRTGRSDAAVLHLVLSVVPDGAACLQETLRTLRPDGRAIIFDKFAPENGRLSPGRRLINLVTTLAGTDVTRRFGHMAAGSHCTIIHEEPSLLHGAYRIILIKRGRQLMISIQSKVHVDGIQGTELLDFLLNCTDEQYQAWWPGTHLAFHTVERRPDHVGSVIYMDEYVGRRRLRMKGIVTEVASGKRVVWQFKQIVRLPAWLVLEAKDNGDGVTITHTIEAGFRGVGRILDPVLRLYFADEFEQAMDEHTQAEFSMLAAMLRDM